MLNFLHLLKGFHLFVDSNGEDISKDTFVLDVYELAKGLQLNSSKAVNLYCDDTYVFSVCFFASLLSGKEIVIFSNDKSIEWSKNDSELWITEANWKQNRLLNTEMEPLYINNDARVCFYTSGSTGHPKKVIKKFINLYAEVEELEKTFGHKLTNYSVTSSVSHNHIYGFLFKILWPLASDRKIFIENCIYQEDIVVQAKVNDLIFISTPAFFKRLDDNMELPKNLKFIFCSGGLLTKQTSERAESCLGVLPCEIFGSTETGGVAYRFQISNECAWKPFSVVNVELTNEGLMQVESPFIFDKDFIMSDCAQWTDNKRLNILGRVDRVVKIEEKRISLLELERSLNLHQYVLECVVFALEVEGRQQTAAIIVLNEVGRSWYAGVNKHQANQVFRKYMACKFDLVVVPRKYRFLDSLPVNSQGKSLIKNLESCFYE